MLSVFEALAECFMTGIVAGLTLWGLARVGLVPVIGLVITDKEDDE